MDSLRQKVRHRTHCSGDGDERRKPTKNNKRRTEEKVKSDFFFLKETLTEDDLPAGCRFRKEKTWRKIITCWVQRVSLFTVESSFCRGRKYTKKTEEIVQQRADVFL